MLKEKEATIKVRKLIEYLLNDINEYSTALYLRHVHGQAVADLFAGDDLYGVDMSLPIHERVEKAKKQVAKDRANATLAAAARGVSAGGKRKSAGRGRGGRQQQQQQQRQPFSNSQQSSGMGRGGGGGGGGAPGGVIGGATRCAMAVVPQGTYNGTARTISRVRARDPESFVPRCVWKNLLHH